jgi:hypothetical protein
MADSAALSYSGGFGRQWGHSAPAILIAAIVAVIGLGFRPYAVGELSLTVEAALLVLVLLTWLRMREHDRRLCELCARSMPLNAAGEAARFQRRFWLAHSGSNWRLLVPYLLVLLGTNFLTSTPGRVVWALAQSTMVYLILAYSTHRRLQPWCPWCAGGGGGSDTLDLDPDLPRGSSRQLV